MKISQLETQVGKLGGEIEQLTKKKKFVEEYGNFIEFKKEEVTVADPVVKKVATIEEKPSPTEERLTNKLWFTKAQAMQDHLMKQKKISILVPTEPHEKVGVVEERVGKDGRPYQVHISGAIITPQLNGFKFMIPKGRYYDVPEQIALVVSNSQQQTLSAGDHIAIDRIDERTGKPVSDAL